jgi:uncharacterized protein (DUF58 family)
MKPTPLNLSALTIVAWALFLGVLVGRAELFLATVPLLVAVVAARLQRHGSRFVLSLGVPRRRLFEGENLTVTVTVTAHSPIPMIEMLGPMPPETELGSGHNRAMFRLQPGQQVRWTYELRCGGRGYLHLDTVYLRLWDRSGFCAHETRYDDPKPVWVYPRALPLRRLPRPRRTQTFVGNYVSPSLGEGLEPGDIRPFVPGDRIRRVNWRASLRLGRLHVSQYQQERNADVVLMLDTLAEVGAPPATSLDLGVRAAASLATAYLSRKDRVGLIEYGGVIRWVKPDSGRAQLERLLDSLLHARAVFTYVAKDLDLIPPRILPPQALVIALSPLLDARFVKAVSDLLARGFDLVVVTVSPIELTRSAIARSPLNDLSCRLWALERRAHLSRLRGQGLTILEWDPAEPLELALARFKRGPRRGVVA